MTIGEKIQRCRKVQKMSQEELAGRLGVSRQAVSKWELNESIPDVQNVVELGRIFGVSLDYLLRVEIEETNSRRRTEDEEITWNQKENHEKLMEKKWYEKCLEHPWVIFLAVSSLMDLMFAFWGHDITMGVFECMRLGKYWGIGYLVYLVVKKLKKQNR